MQTGTRQKNDSLRRAAGRRARPTGRADREHSYNARNTFCQSPHVSAIRIPGTIATADTTVTSRSTPVRTPYRRHSATTRPLTPPPSLTYPVRAPSLRDQLCLCPYFMTYQFPLCATSYTGTTCTRNRVVVTAAAARLESRCKYIYFYIHI